jgi:hypothetical protein
METKPMGRELEMKKMESQRSSRNFRPPGPELPARCPPAPRKKHPAETSAPSDRNFRPLELPPKFRPSSESPSKRPWMLLQGNGPYSELGRNLAGTSGPAGTSAPRDRNFRPPGTSTQVPPKLRKSVKTPLDVTARKWANFGT